MAKPTVLWPTTAQLEMHMDEILEESLRAATLMTQLKKLSHESEERDELEGQLYAGLLHLADHTRDAVKEWDKLTERLPE